MYIYIIHKQQIWKFREVRYNIQDRTVYQIDLISGLGDWQDTGYMAKYLSEYRIYRRYFRLANMTLFGSLNVVIYSAKYKI